MLHSCQIRLSVLTVMPAANFSSTTQSPSHCTSYLAICALAVGKTLPFLLLNLAPIVFNMLLQKTYRGPIFCRCRKPPGSRTCTRTSLCHSSPTSPPPSLKGCSSCLPVLELGILMNLQHANSFAYSRSCYAEDSWNQDRVGFVLPP